MAAFAGAGLMAELLPFSLSQQEVWLDQRTWPDSTHLNIGGAGFIDGKFDLGVFRQAFLKLIEECEALRLVPRLEEGGAVAVACLHPGSAGGPDAAERRSEGGDAGVVAGVDENAVSV